MPGVRRYTVHKVLLLAWGIALLVSWPWLDRRWPAAWPGWTLGVALLAAWMAGVLVWLKAKLDRWEVIARELGFRRTGGDDGSALDLTGQANGRIFDVRLVNPKADAHPDDETILETTLAPPLEGFRLRLEDPPPLSGACEAGRDAGDGLAYVRTGDDAFDERFWVATDRAELAQEVLSVGVREALAEMTHDTTVEARGASLRVEVGYGVLDVEPLRADLRGAARLAQALEAVGPD